MPLDRFLIAPQEVGLQNDIRPWLIPDSAYEQLTNAYIYRGRIRKRFGSRYMIPITTPLIGMEQYPSRLRVSLGVGAGPFNIPNTSALSPLKIGQIFTLGNVVFTITALGAGVATLTSNLAITATIDSTVTPNTVTFAGAVPPDTVYWYPSLPVMGLIIWQTSTINNEPTIAFDTQFAYQFTSAGWDRLSLEAAAGDATWSGTDSQFFWGYTYQGTNLAENFLFVTNFNGAETNFMRYLDQSFTWHSFSPRTATAAGNNIIGGRIIVGFHDHMVILNTIENDSVLGNGLNFKNRARYCAIGSPIDDAGASPVYFPWIDNKNDVNFRGGGFVDNLQTQEQIVSAEFIKDRLIVYYERETWELVYTGNQQIPFVWQQINTEFGAQSTFSKVPFDTQVLAIAQNGITACTGANVERIDEKIPNEVFNIRNTNDGVLRVQGIRDFKVEQVYWAIPSASIAQQFSQIYPNQVLVYNYKTGSWAYNTDSFTALGYWTQQPQMTWGNTVTLWQNMTQAWGDGSLQSNFRHVIAGNQEGFVLIIDPDLTRNAGALQITNMTASGSTITITAINHNLTDIDIYTNEDEYVYIENIKGATGVGFWTSLNGGIYPIDEIIDANTFTIAAFPIADPNPYRGGGTVARVSNLNILSKQWNPYAKSGQNVFIQKMNFLVSRTGGVDQVTSIPYGGEVTVDYYPSTSKYSMLQNSVPGQLISNGILETRPYDPIYFPFESEQDRLWHSIYYACDGNAIQIRIIMRPGQIDNPDIAFSDFQLHGIILETMPTSVRIG